MTTVAADRIEADVNLSQLLALLGAGVAALAFVGATLHGRKPAHNPTGAAS